MPLTLNTHKCTNIINVEKEQFETTTYACHPPNGQIDIIMTKSSLTPSHAGDRIFWASQVNTKLADDLAAYVKSSTVMLLIVYDYLFFAESFQCC